MSKITFNTFIDMSSAATPSSGYLVAYDLDGMLKQKDQYGVVTLIGATGAVGPIGPTGIGTTNKSVDTRGFTASIAETITHNLNTNSVIVQNYDSTGLQIIAGSVSITGTGSVSIAFSQTLSSVKTVIIG